MDPEYGLTTPYGDVIQVEDLDQANRVMKYLGDMATIVRRSDSDSEWLPLDD